MKTASRLAGVLLLVACAQPRPQGMAAEPAEPAQPTQQPAATAKIAPATAIGVEEATIADLQAGMTAGRFTSKDLVEAYLRRIHDLDKNGPTLLAVLEINPDAIAIATALDDERRTKGARGSLHGIPVLIKDNIDTADHMMTTAGSLALMGVRHPNDSAVAEHLRDAGAVILGKTNMTEWADARSTHSSSGWSGRGGQTRNAYALDRSPSGSSSGTGVAISTSLATIGVGTETDGSVVSPSSVSSLVGIKPTVGLVSRAGIIPISHRQDTAGPMARTVADAATLLGVLTGVDARDPATKASAGKAATDYSKYLDPNGLKGARIGVLRKGMMGFSPAADLLVDAAVAVMQAQGAFVVDPVLVTTPDLDAEADVLLYERKTDLNLYLGGLGADSPVHSLADVIAFNEANGPREMTYFGQEVFLRAQKKGPLTDEAYRKALQKMQAAARAKGIDAAMDKDKLDALVGTTESPAWPIDLIDGDHYLGNPATLPAVAGYPHITVPAGFVFGLPVGVSFIGRAWSEGTLIRLAYAYEQASKMRRPPTFAPTADLTPPH